MAIKFVVKPDDPTHFTLSGSVDDSAEPELTRLRKQAGSRCTLDLAGIDQVDSLGVKAWIEFMLPFSKERKVILEKCSPAFITQVNMIPGMDSDCELKSVIVPCRCEWCDNHEETLVDLDSDNIDPTTFKIKCSKCGKDSGLFEEGYFDFLKDRSTS